MQILLWDTEHSGPLCPSCTHPYPCVLWYKIITTFSQKVKPTWKKESEQWSQTSLSCWTGRPVQTALCTCARSQGQTVGWLALSSNCSSSGFSLWILITIHLPSAYKVQHGSCGPCSCKYLFPGQGSPCEPVNNNFCHHTILSDNFFSQAPWFCFYRSTTWVEEPICVFPTEKVALGELLTPGHLTTPFKMKTVFSRLSSSAENCSLFGVIIHSPSTAVRQSEPRPRFESRPLFRASTSLDSFLSCMHTYRLYLWDLYLYFQAVNWYPQHVYGFADYVFDVYPPNRNNVNLLLVLLVGLLHYFDASLVIVLLAILKKCSTSLRIKVSAS